MTSPQPGIFALGTRSHHHLEFRLTGDAASLPAAVRVVREAANTVLGVNVVVGFGPTVWRALAPAEMPVGVAAGGQRLVRRAARRGAARPRRRRVKPVRDEYCALDGASA